MLVLLFQLPVLWEKWLNMNVVCVKNAEQTIRTNKGAKKVKKKFFSMMLSLASIAGFAMSAYALGETDVTVTYKVTTHSSAGDLVVYTSYNIAATEDGGYWLQRVTHLTPDAKPLSITQTLLDSETHAAKRYIMHRPANMDRPESVVDLPLAKMGKEEILPNPAAGSASGTVQIETEAGAFNTQETAADNATLWLSADVPVLGVAKAETTDWTMELVSIANASEDLFLNKPAPGGVVYMNEE